MLVGWEMDVRGIMVRFLAGIKFYLLSVLTGCETQTESYSMDTGRSFYGCKTGQGVKLNIHWYLAGFKKRIELYFRFPFCLHVPNGANFIGVERIHKRSTVTICFYVDSIVASRDKFECWLYTTLALLQGKCPQDRARFQLPCQQLHPV